VTAILAGIRFAHAAVPWLVGLYITAAYWFTRSSDRARAHQHIFRHPPARPSWIHDRRICRRARALALTNWLLRATSDAAPLNPEAQL